MTIDGTAIALGIKKELRTRVAALRERYGRVPCLAAVLVGDNPASRLYVRSKIEAAAFVGIEGIELELPSDVSEATLLEKVAALDADPSVDGILVQLPLPPQINPDRVIDVISPAKDVDGFHPSNVAALHLGRPCTLPCTPKGVIRLIDSTATPIDGKRAVVVGRSNIVGKPVARLLQDRNATVTVAHSHTVGLADLTREADILVVATGHAGLVDGSMIKPGAVVIDVGITREAACPGDATLPGTGVPVPGEAAACTGDAASRPGDAAFRPGDAAACPGDAALPGTGVPVPGEAASVRGAALVSGTAATPVTGTSLRSGTRLRGDVDFASASRVASFITPVPGGVGPMTVAMLMENTIECFERRLAH